MHTLMRDNFVCAHPHVTAEHALNKLFCLDNSDCLVKEFKQMLGESYDESNFEGF